MRQGWPLVPKLVVLTLLPSAQSDYTTETWASSADDNIVGCFNDPGLGNMDNANWAGTPTGDGDVAGKCMSMCKLRTDGKTALVALRQCNEFSPMAGGNYLTNSNGNYGCECYCGSASAAYEADSATCVANCPPNNGGVVSCGSTPSTWCQSSHTCVMTAEGSSSPLSVIVGAAAAGGALLFLLLVLLLCRHSRKAAAARSTVTPGAPAAKGRWVAPSKAAQAAALNAPGRWDFFISHTQRDAEAKLLAEALYGELDKRGHACWLDVRMAACDEAAMAEGVRHSKCLLAVVTNNGKHGQSYFSRPLCRQEILWAHEAHATIVPVHGQGDKARISEFVREAAQYEGLRAVGIGKLNFAEFIRTSPKFIEASIDTIVQQAQRRSTYVSHASSQLAMVDVEDSAP